MKTLSALFLSCCLALAAVFAAMPAQAATTLTYANFPPAPTFPCIQMERWKTEVEKRTNGQVAIQTFPGSTLLGAKNMYVGVQQGQADIGCLCMSYQPGVFPVTTVLELPVGYTSSVVPSMVLWDVFEKFQPAAFKDLKVLALFTTAPSNIMSKTPVRTLADLKGLELRASGGASKVLEMLGATPVSMPMSETPEALQKGLVKGLLSSLEVLKDFNFANSCRFETMTNFQVYPFAVVMNKSKWAGLPEDVKKVFDELRVEQTLWTGQYMDAHVNESLAWSKDKYGIEVIKLSGEDQSAAAKTLEPMIEAWKAKTAKAGLPAEDIYKYAMERKTLHEATYGK